MLNKILLGKLAQYPELLMMYTGKLRLYHPDIMAIMSTRVRSIRNKNKRGNDDPYAQKLIQYKKEGDWFRARANALYKERETILYDLGKSTVKNTELGKWRSIEFECIFKSNDSLIKFSKFVAGKKYHDAITIKGDGSIARNEDDFSGVTREVVVSYYTGNEQMVRDVCESLKDKAYVNKSCGTHVHFDFRNHTQEQVMDFGARLGMCVPALKTILPNSRRINKFCQDGAADRYAFINLTAYRKYRTLEVRAHSGTINADKILNWIKMCEVIMSKPKVKTPLSDIKEVAERFEFSPELVEYVSDRVKKFSNARQEEEN